MTRRPRAALRRASAALSRRIAAAVPPLLIVAGLALIAAAAFTVSLPLGLLVAGFCCLVLHWCITSPPPK